MKKLKTLLKRIHLYNTIKVVYCFFRNIFMPLGAIRNYIIFPIKAFLRTKKVNRFYKGYEDIDKYHNKYKGKRCFVIATGPSLRMEDVEKLDGEYTFAVNSFYKVLGNTNFRPTFYALLDPDVQEDIEKQGEFHPSSYCKEVTFLNDVFLHKRNYKKVMYLPVCYQNHWYKLGEKGFDYSKNLKWTDNLLWGIYDKYTITNCIMDIAIYMGFKEIYLLGTDCNYSGPTSYFTDPGNNYEKKSANMALATQMAMTAGYEFMEKRSKSYDVKIYNATRGGMLEAFQRVDFDSVFVE